MQYNNNNYLSDDRLPKKLAMVCQGLSWLSEADCPLQVVCWQNTHDLDSQILLKHYNYVPQTKIETTTLESFFASVTTEQEWHGDIERAFTQRYRILKNLLQKNLQEIQVYLVGEVEIDVYILGKSYENAIIGISTKIVET